MAISIYKRYLSVLLDKGVYSQFYLSNSTSATEDEALPSRISFLDKLVQE